MKTLALEISIFMTYRKKLEDALSLKCEKVEDVLSLKCEIGMESMTMKDQIESRMDYE